VKKRGQDHRSSDSLRDRAGTVLVVHTGLLRRCLGCSRIMTQVEAAQHTPSLCCRGEHGIELHGRVIQSVAQA
jgi:hypothetical protein